MVESAPSYTPFTHSSSVQLAISRLSSSAAITAWEFAKALLLVHPDYADIGKDQVNALEGPIGGTIKPVSDWLEALSQLFDPKKLTEISTKPALIGLTCLEKDLKAYLSSQKILQKVESKLKEPFDSLLLEHKRIPYLSPNAGYLSDAVNQNATDRLNIEREVANIATVLCSKRVSPPISIGLFGDWGSGKSFFMAKLKKQIEAITGHYSRMEQEKNKVSQEWCARVVQIEFNAWHFSDANLWASLVSGIYEGIFEDLNESAPTDKQLKKDLQAKAQDAKGVEAEAQMQLKKANDQVEAAKGALQQSQENVVKSEKELKKFVGLLSALFKENEKVKQELDIAAKALGAPQAAETYEALQYLDTDLKSLSRRSNTMLYFVLRSPWTLLVLFGLIILLPLAIPFLLNCFSIQISDIEKQVTAISTIIFGIITWGKVQVDKGLKFVSQIETAAREAQSLRQKALESDPEIKEAHKALEEAKINEQAALEQLQLAQAKRLQLENELKELRPERKLLRLIEQRSQTEAYSKHLGIISLIRQDFEKMSELLQESINEDRNPRDEPASIQRIILYIDDLDRCRPDRVIEVLEAVHLLLAFPLFIVVVGVDPRWLRHSLAEHYPTTLYEKGNPLSGDNNSSFYATPQDYLEKIFQIPFALRPVEKEGFVQLVGDLLGPLQSKAENDQPVSPEDTNSKPKHDDSVKVDQAPGQTQHFIPTSDAQLEFEEWEKEDIKQLWPLFQTPRTIKRFINIYRIIRASLDSKESVRQFAGTAAEKGEYQLVILLLALVTNFPNVTNELLSNLENWLSTQKNTNDQYSWRDIISMLKNEASISTGEHKANWDMMVDALEQIQPAAAYQNFSKATIEYWALQTSRYSFSIRPPRSMT